MKNKYVITITRQFGSMGRPIAMKMSELLGIEFYDRDLVDEAAEKLNLPASFIDENEESAKDVGVNTYSRMRFPLGRQNTTEKQDMIFNAQKNIIKFLAEKESCIIVGRCSDFILADMPNRTNIYIYANYEDRLKHCIEDFNLSESDSRKMIKSVDEARKAYHMNYAGYEPGDLRYMDILINSSFLGIAGTAEFLANMIKSKYL